MSKHSPLAARLRILPKRAPGAPAGIVHVLDSPRRATCLYLGFILLCSSIVKFLMISSLRSGGSEIDALVTANMWCPAVSALACCYILGRGTRCFAWNWPKQRYLVLAYMLPLVYTSLAYGSTWAVGSATFNIHFVEGMTKRIALNGFSRWGSLAVYLVLSGTVGVVRGLASALGEEIGWRGFFVPELAKQMSFTRLSILSGLVWGAWHGPDILLGGYADETRRWYFLAGFTVMATSVGVILNWITLKSGSLWPAAILHASHNVWVIQVFDPMTLSARRVYTTDFGVALIPFTFALALYFWTRRREVEHHLAPATATGRSGASTDVKSTSAAACGNVPIALPKAGTAAVGRN